MDKGDKDLIKLFGLEGIASIKTLVDETPREVKRKKPNDAAYDIRALLDEITIRVASRDIIGCIKCLHAIQLRTDYMLEVAEEIRKHQGK